MGPRPGAFPHCSQCRRAGGCPDVSASKESVLPSLRPGPAFLTHLLPVPPPPPAPRIFSPCLPAPSDPASVSPSSTDSAALVQVLRRQCGSGGFGSFGAQHLCGVLSHNETSPPPHPHPQCLGSSELTQPQALPCCLPLADRSPFPRELCNPERSLSRPRALCPSQCASHHASRVQ